MKLLFITRKYPPMVGGMEKVSYNLANELSKKVETTLITWGGSQKFLPFILPLFLIKALYLIPKKEIDHIYLGDALLSPLGLIIKTIYKVKTSVTVHGLDITFNFPGYQLLVPYCLKKMDKIICISQATFAECLKRGINKNKIEVIPWGVYPNEFIVKASRRDLEKIIGINLDGKKVLITVGRLVERKGVYWFIKNVFPKLSSNTIYLIIGEGPDFEKVKKIIKKLDINDRVFLLGKVSEKNLKIIYNTSDLFVMPNIKIPGTIEGFGVVAIEASSTGLPVVGSNLEGIKDSVRNKKNGLLLEPGNKDQWKRAISLTLDKRINRKQISDWVLGKFDWMSVAEKYIHSLSKLRN